MPQAIVVSSTGGPEVLEATDTQPRAGEGEVLIDVAAAGVNFIDTYQRGGVYPMTLPFTIGLEGAGTVTELGTGVHTLQVGDRVAWAQGLGSYAEQVALPESVLAPVPDSVGLRTAAAAMLQGLTVHYLLTSTYPVKAGDHVLVHAGAGGVGLLLIQWAKKLGATVVTTASTEQKRTLARAAGADHAIAYPDFAAQVRELTDGVGVHVVYDGVGKDTFDGSIASLRKRGYLVLFGGASGQVPPFDLQRLNSAGSLFVTRPTLAHYVEDPAEFQLRTRELFAAISTGLDVRISATYALSEAQQAHRDLEARKTTGKVLLIPGQ